MRVLRTLSIVTLILIIGSGCKSKKADNSQSIEINVAYLPIIPDLPLFVAIEEGLFQKHGLTPNLIKVSGSGNQVIESIARGDADIGYLALSTVLEAEQQAPGSFYVSHFNVDSETLPNLYGLVVKDTTAIKTVADLKGKKIGTFPGAAMLALTRLMLKANSLNPDNDVTILQLAPPAQVSALDSKQVDALLTLEPIVSIAENTKSGFLIDRYPLTPEIATTLPSGALVFSKAILKNEKIKAEIINIIDEAIDFTREFPERSSSLYSKFCDLPPAIANQLPTLHYWKNNEIDTVILQDYVDILYNEKILRHQQDIKGLIVNE